MTKILADDPIDAVITWVDGTAPSHRRLRAQYMAQSGETLGDNARNPHRWEQSDEIYYCLRSIHHHAPWVRRLWIVVDTDGPDLSTLPQELRDKVSIVQHSQIFAGFEHVLPTFNSLAIESMMWRIDGLAERYLYFNDDVFLTNPLSPPDVFRGADPVLRGQWVNYASLHNDPAARDDPAKFNHFMQINGAALCGFDPDRLFACAHVVHPFRRSVMAQLFECHHADFMSNISHRFRVLSQFSPQGAHTHFCIKSCQSTIYSGRDYLHITSGQGVDQPPEQTRALLTVQALAEIKFLCVNDLPQLDALVPDARDLIARAVGDERA